MYTQTTATLRIAELKRRIRAVAGGTSASKTISILLILIHMAQTDTEPKLTSVVSESMPHLKKAAMSDFLDIMKKHKYYKEDRWNRTDSIYTFETGSRIEFFGVDTAEKVHGPRRDRLFVNEANNVKYLAFDQLEVRTRDVIFLDWNPTNEFWFYSDVLPTRTKDIDFITLTYKDNEALEPSIIKSIESRQGNKNWWKVYGLGQLGDAEGRIYTNWAIIDEIPHEARLERYGLDFGYSNDPSAIVAIYYYNGGYILDEVTYQKGLSNKQIYDQFVNLTQGLVIADSAEPKSIDELKLYGLNVQPVTKGKDSVNQGIQHVQDQRISVTKESTNLIKEYRNYMWATDKEGKTINTPEDSFNHCMDALRYGFEGLRGTTVQLEIIGYETGLGGIDVPIYNFGDESPTIYFS